MNLGKPWSVRLTEGLGVIAIGVDTLSAAPLLLLGLRKTVDDGFDSVTIGVYHEACVVVWTRVRPCPRAAVIFAAVKQRSLVKLVNGVAAWGGKGKIGRAHV